MARNLIHELRRAFKYKKRGVMSTKPQITLFTPICIVGIWIILICLTVSSW